MPTIFDASIAEQKNKQKKLEEKLAILKKEALEQRESLDRKAAEAAQLSHSKNEPQSPETPAILQESSEMSEENMSPNKTKDLEEHHSAREPESYSSVLRHEKPNTGIFSAFMALPHGVGFESQHEKEKILLVLRQHPVVNLSWMGIALLLSFAPFLLFPIIPLQVVLPSIYIFFLMIAWYLFVTAYLIESFLGWYFNIYIITDERIIDIDFYSLIYKSVSEAKLEKIEDVTSTTAGFLGAFFNFGNITIQTAAEKREFEFARVPQPAKVTKFLNELMLEEEREKLEGRVM